MKAEEEQGAAEIVNKIDDVTENKEPQVKNKSSNWDFVTLGIGMSRI